jgi:subtilisin-like proprotein convertase family protein
MYRFAVVWLAALVLYPGTRATDAATRHDSTDVPHGIVPGETTTSWIEVEETGPIASLIVEVDISFLWDEDLDADLIAPDGSRVALFTHVGGIGADFTRTVFDDGAAVSIRNGQAPFAGRYQPEGNLGALVGKERQGSWQLEVTNDGDWFTGTLNSWALIFDGEAGAGPCPPPPEPVAPDPPDHAVGVPLQTTLSWHARAAGPAAFRLLATTGEEEPDPFTIFELQTDPPRAVRLGDSGGVYALDFSPGGELYGCSEYALWKLTVVADHVTYEKVGDFHSAADDSILMTGLAFHPDGTLYGSTFDLASSSSFIFTIDPKTAFVTQVCRFSLLQGLIWAIDFSPQGELYGVFVDLVLIDTGTCQIRPLGSLIATDLDWAPDGFLYAADSTTRMLYKIDPALGLVVAEYGPYDIAAWGLASQVIEGTTPANTNAAPNGTLSTVRASAWLAAQRFIPTLNTDPLRFAEGGSTPLGAVSAPAASSAKLSIAAEGDPNVVSYDVFLDTVNPPVRLIGSNVRAQQCRASDLVACTTYYWQVVARNTCGETEGPIWSFTTESVPADFDRDCDVDFADLAVFASYWLFDLQ